VAGEWQASGSARLKLGGTDVLVGVKVRARRVRCAPMPMSSRFPAWMAARLSAHGTPQVEIGVPAASQPGNGRVEFCVEVASTVSPVYQVRSSSPRRRPPPPRFAVVTG
jgi:hypothetical protein